PSSAASRIASRWVGEGVAPEDVERLVQIAEGNPLFVEELAASLAEGIPPGAGLPTTVRMAIASRIDALPPEERAAMLDASVVGEQVRDIAGLLAHHWREAGEPDRAIEYLLLAADTARDSWASAEAIRLYERALELATDDHARMRIRLLRGLALVRLEEYERA